MPTHADPMHTARRVLIHPSVPVGLLAATEARRMNVSRLFEEQLATVLAAEAGKPFVAENREGVAAYNGRVAADGVFLEAHRTY